MHNAPMTNKDTHKCADCLMRVHGIMCIVTPVEDEEGSGPKYCLRCGRPGQQGTTASSSSGTSSVLPARPKKRYVDKTNGWIVVICIVLEGYLSRIIVTILVQKNTTTAHYDVRQLLMQGRGDVGAGTGAATWCRCGNSKQFKLALGKNVTPTHQH